MAQYTFALCWSGVFWFCFALLSLTFMGCTALNELGVEKPSDTTSSDGPISVPSLEQIALRAEQDARDGDPNRALREYGTNWFYGQGIGQTMANVGTVVAFPPYALYLLGNAGLALAGYQTLSISSVLPEPVRHYTDAVYDGITSVPGRVTSTLAGEEYRGKRTVENVRPAPQPGENDPTVPPLTRALGISTTEPPVCTAQNHCNKSLNSAN